MEEFWIRVASLFAIVLLLFGYNSVLETRAKDDEIARLTAQIEDGSEENTDNSSSGTAYTDGTYEGEAEGFGGTISVEVAVENGKITGVNLLEAKDEDGAYLEMAKDIILEIVNAQTWDVDTISGATFSSTGIKNAVQQALEKAVG